MGVMLPKPVVSSDRERHGNTLFRSGSACVNGYRDNMEDAHLAFLAEKFGFFGIFDGHVNEHCSAYCAKTWEDILKANPPPYTDERMKEIALEIDRGFVPEREGGSTGTFFVAQPSADGKTMSLQVGNVGDSRVLVSQNGECVEMTKDHKPTDPSEKLRIDSCGGHVENQRVNGSLAVSRAFGDRDYKTYQNGQDQLAQPVIPLPDVTRITLETNKPDNFALLACDGVFEGNFSNEEVIQFVNKELATEQDLAEVSNRVCLEAIARGSKDNISCMIVQFRDGTDFNRGHEFIPGPFNAPTHSGFRNAYAKMAAVGGLKIAECLEKRFDMIKDNLQSEEDGSAFGDGPDPNLTGAERTEWFQQFWTQLADSDPDPQDPRARISQLGLSLPQLIEMMNRVPDDEDDN